MDITISKAWRIPVVVVFIACWCAIVGLILTLVLYWIPEFVWWLYSWVIPCKWNFGTWIISMLLLFLTRIYKFEYGESVPLDVFQVRRKLLNIRFK